jgi:hypothetical protein
MERCSHALSAHTIFIVDGPVVLALAASINHRPIKAIL